MSSLDALWGFSVTVLAGVALGLLESLYTAHLRVARFRRGFHDAADFLLCLVATVVVAAGIAVADWGQLRLWSLVGMGMGVGLFFALGRPLVLIVMAAIERALRRFVLLMARPFAWIGRASCQFVRARLHRRHRRV
ncbi:MAG: spore cortex biosynthesis protein YabQ [Clostridia bacterium]